MMKEFLLLVPKISEIYGFKARYHWLKKLYFIENYWLYCEVSMVVVGDFAGPTVDMSEVVKQAKGGSDLLRI